MGKENFTMTRRADLSINDGLILSQTPCYVSKGPDGASFTPPTSTNPSPNTSPSASRKASSDNVDFLDILEFLAITSDPMATFLHPTQLSGLAEDGSDV